MVTTALAWLWALTTDLIRHLRDPCPACRQPRTYIPQWDVIVLAATWWAYPGPWMWQVPQPQCANPSCTAHAPAT
jgi:hypothetical protein